MSKEYTLSAPASKPSNHAGEIFCLDRHQFTPRLVLWALTIGGGEGQWLTTEQLLDVQHMTRLIVERTSKLPPFTTAKEHREWVDRLLAAMRARSAA